MYPKLSQELLKCDKDKCLLPSGKGGGVCGGGRVTYILTVLWINTSMHDGWIDWNLIIVLPPDYCRKMCDVLLSIKMLTRMEMHKR